MPEADLLKSLRGALRERLRIIEDHAWRDRDPAAQLEALRAVSEQLTTLQSHLPTDTNPTLLHYLQRSSYGKALDFLDTPEREQPTHR